MIRRALFITGGLACAFALLAVLLPMLINPNNFKSSITRQLEGVTGYRIVLGGDVSVHVFPFPRLRADNVSVSNSVAGGKNPFMQLDSLDVGVQFLPLLSGKVVMTNMTLKKPVLRLVKNKNTNNWQTQKMQAASSASNAASSSQNQEKKRAGVVLGSVEVIDGTLSYNDMENGSKIDLTSLNMRAKMASFSSPVDVKGRAVWNGKDVALRIYIESVADMLSRQSAPAMLTFDSQPLTIKAEGKINTDAFDGGIEIQSASVLGAGDWLLGRKTAGKRKDIHLNVKGTAQCSLTRCSLGDMEMKLNDMLLTGSAVYENASATPLVSADFTTDMFDITPYITHQNNARLHLIREAYADEARWSATPIDFSVLRSVDANITLKSEHVVADDFSAGNALFRVRIVRGSLASSFGFADLYKGRGNGTLNLDVDGKVEGGLSLDAVEMQPMLQAIADNNHFSGSLNTRISFQSKGKNQRALVENLAGTGHIHIADGSIKGLDIASMVRNVKSAFTNIDTAQRKTDFSELNGSFTMVNGVINNNDLLMKSPLFRVTGAGKVDVPAYRINYRITPQFVDTLKGQGGKDKEGLGIPIVVTGPLDSPVYAPDLGGLVKEAMKDPKKLRDNLKENLRAVKGLLKGL